MDRRDLVRTLVSAGLGSALVPMTLGDTSVSITDAPSDRSTEVEPLDIALVPIQLTLAKVLPEANYVDHDDYFGFMTEVIYLGLRRIADVNALIEGHLDYVLEMDRQAVELIVGPADRRPQWVTDGILARALEHGVFLSYVGLARTALIKRYATRYSLCDTAALARQFNESTTDDGVG